MARRARLIAATRDASNPQEIVAAISGIRETDVIANLFPLTPAPMGAFVRSASNAYAAGAAIFAVLWPLSRKAFRKQFIPLLGDKSLLQLTLERVAPLAQGVPEAITCVAAEEHRLSESRHFSGKLVFQVH